MALLSAVAAGQVGRLGRSTVATAPYVLESGAPVSTFDLRRLAADGLIDLPMSGPPLMLDRGWRILGVQP